MLDGLIQVGQGGYVPCRVHGLGFGFREQSSARKTEFCRQNGKIVRRVGKLENLTLCGLENLFQAREKVLRKVEQGGEEAGLLQLLFRYEFQQVIGRINHVGEGGEHQRDDAHRGDDAEQFVEPSEQGNLDYFFDEAAEQAQNQRNYEKDHDEGNGSGPEFRHFDVFEDPRGGRRGEFQGERDAEIDDGDGDQLADEAVLDAEVEGGQEAAEDDDVDDSHDNSDLHAQN